MAKLWQNSQKWPGSISGLTFKVQKKRLFNHVTVILRKKNAQIQSQHSKNDTLLKSGKIGHFVKAIVRQDLQNLPTMWMDFKE